MKGVLTIAHRELFSFFVSSTAYVVLTVWLLIQGMQLNMFADFFAASPYAETDPTVTPLTMFFGGTTLFYVTILVVVPLMTMRLVAGERSSGTLEATLTAPVTEAQLILGKYLAAVAMWVSLWIPTLLHVYIISNYGDVDWGVMASSYLGVFGIGLYYMALGLLASTAARTQIIAGVLTALFILGLFALGIMTFVMQGPEAEIFAYLSIWKHMEAFSKGIVDTRYLIFDVSLSAFAVFLSIRILEGRRFE